ncbi:MAG: ThiF family adenylyltransferase [Phycisphaerales bacterium]
MSRYARQSILPTIGSEGQAKLAASHAAIIGVGALGCVTADLLARAGVGTITLIDRDIVEETNLQRQTLYSESDINLPKAEAAAKRLSAINSKITINAHAADFTSSNAESLLQLHNRDARQPAILIDGTDNFVTRYLLNDLAVKHHMYFGHAGVVAAVGTQATFSPGDACLRCVFPTPPDAASQPTCDTAGVLGPAVFFVAAAQAADAIKVLTGNASALSNSVEYIDVWRNTRQRISLAKDPHCPCCAKQDFAFLNAPSESEITSICGQNAIQVWPSVASPIDMPRLASRLAQSGGVETSRFMLRFSPSGSPLRMSIFQDARAIVHGTRDSNMAKSAYAKYVGT